MATAIPSLRALAKAAGCSHQSLVKLRDGLRSPEWPIARKPPWTDADVQKLAEWRKTLQPDYSKPVETTGGAGVSYDQQLKQEKILTERYKRELLQKKHIPKELLEKAITQITTVFVQELNSLTTTLPIQLADRSPDQIEKILTAHINSMRQRLAGERSLQIELTKQEG